MRKVTLVVFLLCFLKLSEGLAQPKWEINTFGGISGYLGDLVETPLPQLKTSLPAFGVGLAYLPKPTFAIELSALQANFRGDDKYIDGPQFMKRSFKFKSSISEVSLIGRLEPNGDWRYGQNGSFKKMIAPYFYGGISFIYINANPDFSFVDGGKLLSLITEDMNKVKQPMTAIAVPFGGGIRIDLSKKLAVDLKVGIRATFSDYIDGISMSANPDANDWYAIAGVNLAYRFGDRDADKDGIMDDEDLCPRVPGVLSARGCPDADGDGVEDLEDLCPYKAGLLDMNGCPDRDGDGIADLDDDCPGVAGGPETNGCPDLDGDKIIDHLDDCPTVAGTKLLRGCPDCDGDGVKNHYDLCPKIPGSPLYEGCPLELYDKDEDGVKNSEDACPEIAGDVNGCPDKDKDGVPDHLDNCPEVFGESKGNGCPVITEKEIQLLELATKAIKFETGSSNLKPESLKSLENVFLVVKNFPNYNIEIIGHTDNVGNPQRNQLLSENRARSCFLYLVEQGIPVSRLSYKGMGAQKPITDNDSEESRNRNRRVEIKLH